MLDETKCWAMKSQQENKLNLQRYGMLQWMTGYTRQVGLGMNALERKLK